MIQFEEWILIIPILIILGLLIYFKINFTIIIRPSSVKATIKLLKAVIILLVICVVTFSSIFIFVNLGVSIFILVMVYVLWLTAYFLVKHKKELLITIFGATIAAKIEAFIAGMSILISTPFGFLYISLGSITWIGLSNSPIGQMISREISLNLPAWLWFNIGVIFCWGITSITKKFFETVESSFTNKLNKSNPKPLLRIKKEDKQ